MFFLNLGAAVEPFANKIIESTYMPSRYVQQKIRVAMIEIMEDTDIWGLSLFFRLMFFLVGSPLSI